jgi:hypothetical protein
MSKASLLMAAAVVGGGLVAHAVEFPLEFKKLTAAQATSFPGGWGSQGQIQSPKPGEIKHEPPAASTNAVYGRFYGEEGAQFVFRLDESQGAGKGYDRLIMDLNNNGDLTDDPVISRDDSAPKSSSSENDHCFFSVTELTAKSVGAWRPVVCAEMNIYNKQQIGKQSGGQQFYGFLRLFAAWYLEAQIQLDGVKQRLAFRDGNCDFKLDNRTRASKVLRRPGDEPTWNLSGRDYMVRDRLNTGQFDEPGQEEMLSSLIYFEAKAYTLTLSGDLKQVRLEPFTGPSGRLALREGIGAWDLGRKVENAQWSAEWVRSWRLQPLVLAREVEKDQWEALTPEVKDGEIIVPTGNYRVASCELSAKAKDGSVYRVISSEMAGKTAKVEAGQTAALECGAPLELRVGVSKRTGGARGLVRSLFGAGSPSEQTVLNMRVTVSGRGGEAYTSFVKTMANQPEAYGRMAPPWFRAYDSDGKQVGSGNFEFG